MPEPHVTPVSIYYEDTDHSGLVYHANYLKYAERSREHVLGRESLVALYRDEGVGFVVYKAEMVFREGARFGDELEVRTTVEMASTYRLIFKQPVYRRGGATPLVEILIELVAVDAQNKLVRLPPTIQAMVAERFPV